MRQLAFIPLLLSTFALAFPATHAPQTRNPGLEKLHNREADKIYDPTPLGVDTVKQHSGYIDIDEGKKHLFYWFFESRSKPESDPIILWFNGGPGGCSICDAIAGSGPGNITRSGMSTPKQLSWNNKASVLYLDQPVGSGYSYGNKVADTATAAKDVSKFLTLFLQKFPQYKKQPLHIHSVSYGGHMVPAIAADILSKADQTVNLKSVSIANGWTDPVAQYKSLPAMACGEGSGYPASVTKEQCQVMKKASLDCESKLLAAYNTSSTENRVAATVYCNKNLLDYFEKTAGRTVYDIRLNGTASGIWDDKTVKTLPNFRFFSFVSQPATRQAIGAGETPFPGMLNMQVFRDFVDSGDFGESFAHLLPSVLQKIPVLIYNGDADYSCNWLGTKAWTESLKWTGQKEYQDAKMLPWSVSGKQLGEYKTTKGLSFVRLFGIGHTAQTTDQATVVLNLLESFLQKGDKFAT